MKTKYFVIGGAVFLLWLYTRQLRAQGDFLSNSKDLPRGIRNNNAGNIRISSIEWRGKKFPNTDGEYEQFIKPADGLYAIFRNLRSYKLKHGITTLRATAERWAPNFENDTSVYIKGLEAATGANANDYFDLAGPDAWKVIKGIVKNENGTNAGVAWYTDTFIKKAAL